MVTIQFLQIFNRWGPTGTSIGWDGEGVNCTLWKSFELTVCVYDKNAKKGKIIWKSLGSLSLFKNEFHDSIAMRNSEIQNF